MKRFSIILLGALAIMMAGCLMAQICNLLCSLPCWNGTLPLNAVTPLFGAPIVIYILLKVKR